MMGNMKRMYKCSICSEFSNRNVCELWYPYLKELKYKYDIDNRILCEGKMFAIIPSLGPVSSCHLLVVPKRHVCSYAMMSKKELDEAERLIVQLIKYVEKKYGNCMVFEHGTLAEDMKSSASCNHAHMHIVACEQSIISYLKKDGLILRPIERLSDIRLQERREKAYFYYKESETSAYIMDDIVQKSQYMRMLFLKVQGKTEQWDWKKNYKIEIVNRMILEMKSELFEEVKDVITL